MALASDTVAQIIREMNKDLQTYDNMITFLGMFYVGKICVKLSMAAFSGLRTHVISKLWQSTNFVEKYGEWAAITGCTAGIGKAYARELAKRGMNIILIGRNMEKLRRVATSLEFDYSVKTMIIEADFSKGENIYSKIQENLMNLEIGILVNNVGCILPYPMEIEEVSGTQAWDMIKVNCGAATNMTMIVLPQMKQRNSGAIINVSSISGLAPTPLMTVYGATKAYMDSFSKGLEFECKYTGITVQTLTPAYVNTQMVKYSPLLMSGGILVPSASVYAKNAILTLGVTSFTAGYWSHALQYWFFKSMPKFLWMGVSGFMNRQFRAEYDANHPEAEEYSFVNPKTNYF